MANSLIAHNSDREPRQLIPVPANGPGNIAIKQYQTLEDEAVGIADIIADLIDNQGYAPEEILVLAQRRSVGNPIHDALTGRNIPSKSYYQEGALESRSAQERLAILKLVVNPQDRIALRWLLGFGSGNFRSGAYARIRTQCEQTGTTPWDVMTALADGKQQIPHTHHLVARFKAIRSEISELGQAGNVPDFVQRWLGKQVAADEPFQVLARELSTSADTPSGLLEALIAAVSLPDIPPDVAEVRIMSLHKSSPVVIIAGCVEGLLPTAPDPDASPAERQSALEEQRRLFFVGLTRVKALPGDNKPGVLVLTCSRSMSLADAMQSGIHPASVRFRRAYVHTSRFIRELGPAAPASEAG
jgi:DNA helicase-2/ATP-dependent DNA helicase PcrA